MKKIIYLLALFVAISLGSCKKDSSSTPSSSTNTPYGTIVGDIYTIAGNGTPGFSGDGSAATTAEINCPAEITLDGSGNLYIADINNNRIRKINTNGIISTIAGDGGGIDAGNGGSATAAEINTPDAVAVDSSGNIYIAEFWGSCIRKVNTSGIISTFAGGGSSGLGDGGPANTAELNQPCGVAVDHLGNVYIADNSNCRIRKVNAGGIISTIAGNGTAGYSGDGGAATAAELSGPHAVVVDNANNIYIADAGNGCIRKVNTGGIISTIAGNGTAGYSGDGGPATSVALYSPYAVAVDASGNIYIADGDNNRIRRVNTSGIISTFAGNGIAGFSGDGNAANLAELNLPDGIAIDVHGNVYVADEINNRIRKVSK